MINLPKTTAPLSVAVIFLLLNSAPHAVASQLTISYAGQGVTGQFIETVSRDGLSKEWVEKGQGQFNFNEVSSDPRSVTILDDPSRHWMVKLDTPDHQVLMKAEDAQNWAPYYKITGAQYLDDPVISATVRSSASAVQMRFGPHPDSGVQTGDNNEPETVPAGSTVTVIQCYRPADGSQSDPGWCLVEYQYHSGFVAMSDLAGDLPVAELPATYKESSSAATIAPRPAIPPKAVAPAPTPKPVAPPRIAQSAPRPDFNTTVRYLASYAYHGGWFFFDGGYKAWVQVNGLDVSSDGVMTVQVTGINIFPRRDYTIDIPLSQMTYDDGTLTCAIGRCVTWEDHDRMFASVDMFTGEEGVSDRMDAAIKNLLTFFPAPKKDPFASDN